MVFEEGATGVSELTLGEVHIFNWVFGSVWLEKISGLVDIVAEVEVVDFSHVALVEVLSNQDLEKIFAWWQDVALLEHSSELLGSDMAALGFIIVLQLRLDEDSFVLNL